MEDVMSSEQVVEDQRPYEFDELTVQQLNVGRHFKMSSGGHSVVIHSNAQSVGVWLGGRFSRSGVQQIGMFADERMAYFMVWPEEKYWDHGVKTKLPFAISTQGVQVPHPDGTATRLTLKDISDIAKAYKK
jgi:hypothetical protein